MVPFQPIDAATTCIDQIGEAFALGGIEKGWSRTATELEQSPSDIKAMLNRLVQRRNLIVHEGDIARASRPQQVRLNQLTAERVQREVDWLEQLIAAIERVVVAGNPG